MSQRSLDACQEFLVLPVREFDVGGRTSRAALKGVEARALDLDAVLKCVVPTPQL